MVKKLFALASVTALTGVIATAGGAGCSSTTTETTTSGDSGSDSGKKTGTDGGVDEEDAGDPGGNCPADITFSEDQIKTELGSDYKGPKGVGTGDCSQADLTQLEANFKDTSIKSYSDLGTGLSANCVSCVFSKTDDANWGPIVLLASDATKGFGNFGACHAGINNSADCGKAFQYDQFCANAACSECSDSQEQTCIGKVWGTGGACKDLHDSINTKCTDFANSNKACGNTLVQHATVLCGAGGSDGGAG